MGTEWILMPRGSKRLPLAAVLPSFLLNLSARLLESGPDRMPSGKALHGDGHAQARCVEISPFSASGMSSSGTEPTESCTAFAAGRSRAERMSPSTFAFAFNKERGSS